MRWWTTLCCKIPNGIKANSSNPSRNLYYQIESKTIWSNCNKQWLPSTFAQRIRDVTNLSESEPFLKSEKVRCSDQSPIRRSLKLQYPRQAPVLALKLLTTMKPESRFQAIS